MSRNKQQKNAKKIICEQSSFTKKLSYVLIAMGVFSISVISPNIKSNDLEKIDLLIPIIFLAFLIWIFFVMPYKLMTTNKRIVINDDRFMIESNKNKYIVNERLENITWWRRISPSSEYDWGNKIQINFRNKKVMLNQLEFKSFYVLEHFLEKNYRDKQK